MRNLVSLGGKVKKKLGTELDSDRYTFLSLDNAEPDLGNPTVDNSVVISKTSGQRLFAGLGNNLSYDSDAQTINVDSATIIGVVEAQIDSDFIIDVARDGFVGGTGINYDSATGIISAEASYITTVARNSLSGSNGIVYDSATGLISFDSAQVTGIVDSAYIEQVVGLYLDGGTGVTFTPATGTIEIGQPVDSAANVEFNSVTINGTQAIDSARDFFARSVTFDNVEVEFSPQQLAWDSNEDTLSFGTSGGAVIQVGQEVVYNVKNQTGSTIDDGTPVMAVGTLGGSGRILVSPMDGTDPANAKFFLGVTTETINDGDDGKVTHFGKVRGIDLSTYDEGDVLWISTDSVGAFTTDEPTDGMKLPVAFVINNSSNGTMMVRATNGVAVRDLNDINFTSLSDHDILSWDSASQRWLNTNTPTFVSVDFDSAAALTGTATSLSTTTETAITTFSATAYGGGKFVIQAYDATASERHITELLVTHNGDSAYATEYGTVYTGTDPLASFDVDISAGDVRILATGASSNSTRYTVLEQLMME